MLARIIPFYDIPVTGNKSRNTIKVKTDRFQKTDLPKEFLKGVSRMGGRNSSGKIVIHGRGGAQGNRRMRTLSPNNVEDRTTLVGIYRAPNRTAPLARWERVDVMGVSTYYLTIAPNKYKVGQSYEVSLTKDSQEYDLDSTWDVARLKIKNIKAGTVIYDVELNAGSGGQIARAAGTRLKFHGLYKGKARVVLPSGRRRLIDPECLATIGRVAGRFHRKITIGSAGANRGRGARPTVRGSTKNAVDSPHGGGEGKSGPGKPSQTPWGRIALGPKTTRASTKLDW